jgi:hypothetical protein
MVAALLPTIAFAAPVEPKSVVTLAGTSIQFFADEQGVLHYAGDTRGIAGKDVDWTRRVDMNLEALRAQPMGDLYLSTSLVKIGNAIYLAKWEVNQSAPRLLQVQSIDDLQLIGVNAANYNAVVFEQAEWEKRFGMSVEDLERGALEQATYAEAAPSIPAEESHEDTASMDG